MSDIEQPSGNRDVLSKADEFIKRRRAQLGGTVVDGPLQIEPADDIPLLTDIVGEAELPAALPEPALPPQRDFSAEVAHELDTWLDENLPQVVVYAMDGITDRLIQQIHASAREDLLPRLKRALRDDAEAGED